MLTKAEQRAYLKKLGFEEIPEPTKEQLNALISAHQMSIPFSTMRVHRNGTPDLSQEALFENIIEQHSGGYCFELNKLFQALLESLGYEVRPALCRSVRGRDIRMPINHRGMIVSLDGEELFVDVGFGGPMPAGTLTLNDATEHAVQGETYLVDRIDDSWWKIDRLTKATNDLYDDEAPIRRQTELEVCTATVEDIDFDALNAFFSLPGTLFRDHEIMNLRTIDGYKGFRDDVLTLRQNGTKTTESVENDIDKATLLAEHFGYTYA